MSGETEQALDTEQTTDTSEQQDTASAEAETAVGELEGGEQQATEQAVEEETQVAPEDDPRFARQFAALARKDRELRQRQAELKQAQEQRDAVAAFDKAMRDNPLKALQDYYGYDTDKLVKAMVTDDHERPDPNLTRLEQIEAKIREYEEAGERHRQQQLAAQQAKQLDDFKGNIRSMIDADTSDKFELIKAQEEYEMVFDFCVEHWNQHKKALPIEKAAALAEDYLLKKAEKALKAKKLQAASAEKKQGSQTLTNDMRNSTAATTAPPATEEERLARAASLLEKAWLD